jgi:hypothetical protein
MTKAPAVHPEKSHGPEPPRTGAAEAKRAEAERKAIARGPEDCRHLERAASRRPGIVVQFTSTATASAAFGPDDRCRSSIRARFRSSHQAGEGSVISENAMARYRKGFGVGSAGVCNGAG